MKLRYLLTILLLIISLSINAEITTDGSLGSHANLPGPNYLIGANLGHQMGGNLFHSFKDFNLNSLESATFSGPNNVSNIISRVTGGNPSNIDGLIRSTIPNADMYLLNPYGIMFGPNAQLDIQGSFHASTADYLRLGEGGRFDARNHRSSILTIAPIEAFGFLTDSPASITTQDSSLSLPTGKTLSLIGGDLDLNGSTPPVRDESPSNFRARFTVISSDSEIFVNSGRINLASVASEGEVVSNWLELNLGNAKGGQIRIDKSFVSVNGQGDGSIFIRGKNLIVINSSQIQAKKQRLSENNPNLPSDNDGQKVSIDIEVETLSFNNKSSISGDSLSTENSGDIVIKAKDISFRNGSEIWNGALSLGDAGNVRLIADNILLEESGIGTVTNHEGDAGDIYIKANEVVTITGASSENGWNSGLVSVSSAIGENGGLSGAGGDIILEAKELIITKGGKIRSSTIAFGNMRSQQAGNIDIRVSDSIRLSGINPYGDNSNGLGSGITATSIGNAGNAGTISLTANALYVTDGADIIVNTSGLGQGGNINLNINGPISISGDSTHIKLEEPKISQLIFQQNFPHLKDRISKSGIYANSLSNSNDAGNAGNINIQAHQITLGKNNKITTETENATGGNINIGTSILLDINSGQIATSVYAGTGDGGNITIENPTFVVLNQGQIKAKADEGHGGNIRIVAEQFIKSPDSLVSASSRLGIDGEVNIDSPTVDMNAFIVVLQDGFVETQLKQCTNEEIENPSTFKVDFIRDRVLPFEKFLKLK